MFLRVGEFIGEAYFSKYKASLVTASGPIGPKFPSGRGLMDRLVIPKLSLSNSFLNSFDNWVISLLLICKF